MTQEDRTPLLEAIVADILNEVTSLSPANSAQAYAYGAALGIVRQRFATLSEEKLARVIMRTRLTVDQDQIDWLKERLDGRWVEAIDDARAVMKMLRKE